MARTFRLLHVGAAALSISLLVAAPAAAQQGFALGRFDPAAPASGYFSVDEQDLSGKMRPTAGLLFDWGHKPLVIYNQDGTERSALVSDQGIVHLAASLVVTPGLRLALDLPVAAIQSGQGGTLGGQTFQPATRTALGDLRIGADYQLYGRYKNRLTVAIGANFFAPSGNSEQYQSDGRIRFAPHLLLAGGFQSIGWAAQLAYGYRALSTQFAGVDIGSELQAGLGAHWKGMDERLRVGPELTYSTLAGSPFAGKTSALEALFGAHYVLVPGLELSAGVSTGLSQALGTPAVRGVFALAWSQGRGLPSDRDRDGIADAQDACPDLPGIASADPKLNGCPPDRDQDGVADADDACPDVPGVYSSEAALNGCPPDRDRDGIADAADACPDEPGVADADAKKNGCPPDRDGDGIADAKDACPDKPGVADSDPKYNGCPADRDHDGIADAQDACPDKPGVEDADPKLNGCPPDKDQDGIADAEDACPDKKGVADPDPKRNGCPPDRDRDGIADAEDFCPDQPAGDNPDPDRAGCPFIDTDGDAIADWADNCPNEPGPLSNAGCPEKKKQLVVITKEKIKITEKIYFDFGKATIQKRSFPLLNNVASVILNHPDIPLVQVEGHTDSVGKAEINRKLSQERADAVREYLIKKGGVAAEKLVAKGFGPDRPQASNATEKGREQNRRVEFMIQGPAGEEKKLEVEAVPLAPLTPADKKEGAAAPAGDNKKEEAPALPSLSPKKESGEKPAPEAATPAPEAAKP